MMNPKINLSNHKELRAYQAGFQAALASLVDSLVDGGDINYLIDALEDQANEATADKLRAFYSRRNA